MLRSLIAAGLLLLAPGVTHGQTCLGVPAAYGETAVAGQVGFTDGGMLYGVAGSFHVRHDLALIGRFQLGQPNVGDDITTYGGGLVWTIPGAKPAMCVAGSFEYATWDAPERVMPGEYTGDSFNELSIPVGLGFGTTLPGSFASTTLYAVPQFVWRRLAFNNSGAVEETEVGAIGLFGVTLSKGTLFGGVAGQLATFDRYDPRLVFQLGVMLGEAGR